MLGRKPTALSPERAALAAEIATKAEDEARRAALATATATASRTEDAAASAVIAATAIVEEAKAAAVRYQTALARGSAGDAPETIREARAKLLEAEEHLAVCRAAHDALRAEMEADQDNQYRPAGVRVREAAEAVLRVEGAAEIRAVVAALKAAQLAVIDAEDRWNFFLKIGAVAMRQPATAGAVARPVDEELADVMRRLERVSATWANRGGSGWHGALIAADGAAPWRAALEALQRDAGAGLPG